MIPILRHSGKGKAMETGIRSVVARVRTEGVMSRQKTGFLAP